MRKLVIFVSASIVSTCAISILSGERVTLGAVLLLPPAAMASAWAIAKDREDRPPPRKRRGYGT